MKTSEEKIKWIKLMVRPTFTPLVIKSVMQSNEKNVQQVFGTGLIANLWIPSIEGIEWWVSEVEYERVGAAIFQKIVDIKDFSEIHKEECIKTSETMVKTAKEIANLNLTTIASPQLWYLFEKFVDIFHNFNVFLTTPHAVDSFLTQKIKEEIKDALKQKGKDNLFDEYFQSLMWTEKLPESMKEEEELLQIAKEIEENQGKITERINFLIKEHSRKYCWLTTYAYHLEPANEKFFIDKFNKIKNAATKLKERRKEHDERKQNFLKVLEELKSDEEFLHLIKTAQNYIYLRTYRTDILRKAFFYIQKLIEEIARRANMTKVEIAYFTLEELEGFLLNGFLPNVEEIERRKKHFLIIKKEPNTYNIFSRIEEISKILKEEGLEVKEVLSTLKGTGVFPGIVKGRVKLIFKPEDMEKMKEGDILVTPMTNPSIHSAIVKAGAIVTDEGGITCHAALISRESHIPCVIGTGIATKTLKDGELVEVNSKEGIVRRLKI